MTIEELNYCLKYFYTSERKQDGTCCETVSPKSIRSTIDRFLHVNTNSERFLILQVVKKNS